MRLENRSGYDTEDLRRFFVAGLRATRTPMKNLRVVVTASPIRSRGCASIAGQRMVIAIAAPAHFDLRRLARLVEHESAHLRGYDHKEMDKSLLFSLGPVPDWAKGAVLRYRGRAPAQLPFLRAHAMEGAVRRDPSREALRRAEAAEVHAREVTNKIGTPAYANPRAWSAAADAWEVAEDAWKEAGDTDRAYNAGAHAHNIVVSLGYVYEPSRPRKLGRPWTRVTE